MTPECESAYKETRFNTRQFKCNIHRTIYLWTRNANLRIILYIYMDWWHWNANPRLKKPDSIPVSLSLIYTVPSICDPGCEPAYTNVAGCYTRQLRIHRTIPLRTWKCHVTEDSFIWNLGTYLQPGSLSYNCSFSPSFQFSDYFSFGSVAYVAGLLFANNWWNLLCYTGYFADPGPVLASYTESTGYKIWGRQCTVMWWLQPIWTYRSRNHSNLCKSSLRSMAWMDQCVHWIDRPPPFHWYLQYDDGPRVIGARPHWKISPLTPKLPVSKTRIGSPWIMLCLPSICVLPTPWRWIYLRQWVV